MFYAFLDIQGTYLEVIEIVFGFHFVCDFDAYGLKFTQAVVCHMGPPGVLSSLSSI